MFQPAIKWSGSKRSQYQEILKYFPKEINTYYEPFCGGASMLRGLMESGIPVNRYVCSDLNGGLIDLWNEIKNNPTKVCDEYERMWNELNSTDDRNVKRSYFEMVRARYNREHSPYDFMFIMRTTTNGMCRYNQHGEFNNSYHITRDGIKPDKLRKIVNEWSELLNNYNVEFIHSSYEYIRPENENDFVYLDPPYANTKGMYYGSIDNNKLFDYLRHLPCKYVMSFDGISGEIDNTYTVPSDVYDEHHYILSGNSSFKRTIGKSNDSIVYESLYVKK